MAQTFLSIALCPALLLMLQQAPLLHVHEHGRAPQHVASEHQHKPAAHTHVAHHPEDSQGKHGREIVCAEDDESAIGVCWFHSESPNTALQFAIVRTCALAHAPAVRVLRTLPDRPRIHDPPLPSSLTPRAPPA